MLPTVSRSISLVKTMDFYIGSCMFTVYRLLSLQRWLAASLGRVSMSIQHTRMLMIEYILNHYNI